MQIYLPIAEVSVNVFLLFGLGGLVGILSGMFGVGGGFLTTPLLIFYGIPPAVAAALHAADGIWRTRLPMKPKNADATEDPT